MHHCLSLVKVETKPCNEKEVLIYMPAYTLSNTYPSGELSNSYSFCPESSVGCLCTPLAEFLLPPNANLWIYQKTVQFELLVTSA